MPAVGRKAALPQITKTNMIHHTCYAVVRADIIQLWNGNLYDMRPTTPAAAPPDHDTRRKELRARMRSCHGRTFAPPENTARPMHDLHVVKVAAGMDEG